MDPRRQEVLTILGHALAGAVDLHGHGTRRGVPVRRRDAAAPPSLTATT